MTDAAAARLALELGIITLETEVIAAEAAAGWSVPDATRPLHPWEVRARTRFADLDAIALRHAAAVERALDTYQEETVALVRLLIGQANPATPADLVALLDGWRRYDQAQLNGAENKYIRALNTAATQAYADGFTELASESARQGVQEARIADALDDLTTRVDAARAEINGKVRYATGLHYQLIQVTAGESPRAALFKPILAEAQRFAADPGADVNDVARRALEAGSPTSLKLAGVRDQVRQAMLNASAAGRQSGADALPEPAEVYASELLDKATCGPCAGVDGRFYGSLTDAYVDYPGGGGFIDCEGGARCRGTLVLVWETEQAPSVDVGPFDRVGRFPPDRTPLGPATGPDPGQQVLPGTG